MSAHEKALTGAGLNLDRCRLRIKNLEQHLVVLRARCSIEHAPLQKDPFHAPGRGEMPGLD